MSNEVPTRTFRRSDRHFRLAALPLGGAFLWFTVVYRWPRPRITWVPIIATGGVALLLVGPLVARTR